ncbi:hypothetical protein OTU49_005377 [Cherax quadricarinatus]|uniref:Uncharacterized protein n=2 Tax=Cherax quadricarinatus TaxID=27406 RepID=A0AAW0X6Y8_CHEQU|nr:uncharacterized protein LOC128696546 isoform X3 [Cherax quadricarinatus]XP_053643826.1 uncharacterized protein LOC128696546 isoform X3 [Cherax quadricarinatus]
MLGRCRMRRGVSLEVIVEEDDNAEVVLDPEPLLEDDHDDDDQDDDDDDDSENGQSAPGSPDGSQEAGGRGGGKSGFSAAEERRRRRERRRTIGGLSRARSVSCEALTLLDTSDMESCCSEWDDDDELTTASSNYVTLNRPISRRRILESSQSQCDSEDSGIEYHSNEDDPMLEDQSSIEDRKDLDLSSDDIHDQETATESDDDTIDASSEPSSAVSYDTAADTHTDTAGDTHIETAADTDTNADTVPDVSVETIVDACIATDTDESLDDTITNMEASRSAEVNTDDLSTKTVKQVFEERVKEATQEQQTTVSKYLQEYDANEVLENDKVVIVEKTPIMPARTAAQSDADAAVQEVQLKPPAFTTHSKEVQLEEELQLKRAAYTIRNKEVQLEELPRPHTVRSVKQLFENLNTPVHHFHTWCDLGRFRDIKSNPSSKILRFDRSDNSEGSTTRGLGVGSSFTLPRLASHRTNNVIPNQKSKGNLRSSTVSKESSKQQNLSGRSVQQEQVATQGSQPVALRKPTVHGFNVKKALMEDPRTFHAHSRSNDAAANTNQQGANYKLNTHNTNNHNRKGHVHLAKNKSHHSSEAGTDRSDTESLASDTSEDSGVSNDSHISSVSSMSTYRALDAYASDPSFKWIDPTVMAKIRAVGTTVIFFGPRQRPRHQDSVLQKTTRCTPSGLQVSSSGLQVSRSGLNVVSVAAPGAKASDTSGLTPQDGTRTGLSAPRIVGVVRKRTSSSTISAPNDTSSHHSHDLSHTSSAGNQDSSKCVKWRNQSDTIVYNFTRHSPPTAWM